MRPFQQAALSITAVLLLTACTVDSEPQDHPATPPAEATQPVPPKTTEQVSPTGTVLVVAEHLEAPWSVVFYGQTPLVSERDTTRILELDEHGRSKEVLTVSEARPNQEAGLLGLAIYEDYLYAYFTAVADNRIYRWKLTGDPGSLSVSEPETVFTNIPSADYHDGGRISFGPDGMLYVTTGDAVAPAPPRI